MKNHDILYKENPLYARINSLLKKSKQQNVLRMSDHTLQLYIEQLISSYLQLPDKKKSIMNFPQFCYNEICGSRKLKSYISQSLISLYEALKIMRKNKFQYGILLGKLLEIFGEKFDQNNSNLIMKIIIFFNELLKNALPEQKICIKTGGYLDACFIISELRKLQNDNSKCEILGNTYILIENIEKMQIAKCMEFTKQKNENSIMKFTIHKLKQANSGAGILLKNDELIKWYDFKEIIQKLHEKDQKSYIENLIFKESLWENYVSKQELTKICEYLWVQAANKIWDFSIFNQNFTEFNLTKLEFIDLILEINKLKLK